MSEFDQFVKRTLKAKYYIRYADDFVLMHEGRQKLFEFLPAVERFLRQNVKLTLHPGKVSIATFASGVDFLGWLHFPDHRVLRTATKRRMFARTKDCTNKNVIDSYRGFLKHGNAKHLALLLGGR